MDIRYLMVGIALESLLVYISLVLYRLISYMSKFRSFAITIRPRAGVPKDSEFEKALENWFYKFPYQLFSYEMEGDSRHCHAQIFSDDPKRRSDICKMLARIQEKHDPDFDEASKKVLYNGVKVAYSDEYLKYILKDTDETPSRYIEVLPV